MPLAREVVRDLAVEHGACIRPVQLRRTNLDTGDVEQVLVPCGHTLASVCPSCARTGPGRCGPRNAGKAGTSRTNPTIDPGPGHRGPAMVGRAARRGPAAPRPGRRRPGRTPPTWTSSSPNWTSEITSAGMRGKVLPARPARRHRSTRRRQDAPDLPRRKVAPRTVGKTYTAPDGKTFRPVDVRHADLPVATAGSATTAPRPTRLATTTTGRPGTRWHFAALFDRFIQNLRRYLGYDVQYFAAVEPQRRLAPHIHIAMRGTVSRAELRRVLAATYHQVWWPDTTARPVRRRRAAGLGRGHRHLPRPGHRGSPAHLGPGPRRHRRRGRAAARGPVRGPVRRPGRAGRIQGRRPVHRLPDQVPHQAGRPTATRPTPTPQQAHAARLAEALRYRAVLAAVRELAPLRHPAQERPARPGPRRAARARPTTADHLGYAGRRVLTSRKWSGKTLADHRADRKNWLLATLGVSATDPARYAWEPVAPGDPDHMEHARRLLHVVADRDSMASRTRRSQTQGGVRATRAIFRQPGGQHDTVDQSNLPPGGDLLGGEWLEH